MYKHHLITAPSVILIAQPQLVADGIRQWAEEQGLSDLPKLYEDTPLGRIFDHLAADPEDRALSDGEVLIEFCGRQCYDAWERGRENYAYIDNILAEKHGSVLAHGHFTFVLTGISRGMSLELNRHAAGNDISQASLRFINVDEASFVVPPALLKAWDGDLKCESARQWYAARVAECEDYNRVQAEVAALAKSMGLSKTLTRKRANEAAKQSMPHALETKGTWTFNYRSLRHIINLRGSEAADLEIRRFAAQLAMQCKVMSPNVFHDVEIGTGDFGVPVVTVQYEKP